jgi:MFS family permease
MLLRASLGMAIAILLQAFATNVWQLFILTRKVTLKVKPDHIDSASCEVTPNWETYSGKKGRMMLLRASLGMAIAILLQAFATNVWQLFILRAVMGQSPTPGRWR